MSESDSSLSDTSSNVSHTSHLTGRLKPTVQKSLNLTLGPCSSQTEEGKVWTRTQYGFNQTIKCYQSFITLPDPG